jgi:beta-fructofuranosidase
VLRLADSWIWDFWFADDGRTYHVFFLKAARSLADPELRHRNVAIGHATSGDLIHWTDAADVLAPAARPAFDDVATWTGSVIRGPAGAWCTSDTGSSSASASSRITGAFSLALRPGLGTQTS